MATVNISSASRTTNVVSIATALAHGQTVGQWATLQGITYGGATSFNGVFQIASAVDSTHYTFAQTGENGTATASTGTTAPTRQIFALEISPGEPGVIFLRAVLWFPISTPVPKQSFATAVPSSIPHPVTTVEAAALQAGILVEESRIFQFPATWAAGSKLTNTEQFIQDFYAGRLAALQQLTPPGAVDGFWYDGSSWQL